MSQHHFNTTHSGKPVCVTAGWDRPLQEFFMFITEIRAPISEEPYDPFPEETYLYNHLGDRNSRDQNLSYYVAKAAEFGITVPESMIREINHDSSLNAGNRICKHHADGSFTDDRGRSFNEHGLIVPATA